MDVEGAFQLERTAYTKARTLKPKARAKWSIYERCNELLTFLLGLQLSHLQAGELGRSGLPGLPILEGTMLY